MPAIADSINIDKSLLVNLYLRTKDCFDLQYVFIEFIYNETYLEYLNSHPQVVEVTINSERLLVKFKLNKIQQIINKIYISGKYSTFPDSYKIKILNYFSKPKSSNIGQVLFKLPILKQKLENNLRVKISDLVELGVKTNIIEESYE